MRFAIASAVLGILLSLGTGTLEAGKGKQKGKHGLAGAVVSVSPDANNPGSAAVTIKTHGNKKKGTAGSEVTVTVTKDTKINRITGNKGDRQANPATLADLRAGERVRVQSAPGNTSQAAAIEILHARKKK